MFASALLLPALGSTATRSPWTHPEAKYRCAVHLDASQLTSDVDGFPLTVRLGAGVVDLSHVRDGGGVIVEDAVTGHTLTSRVEWSADRRVVQVRTMVPKLRARSVDGMLWLYYGGVSASSDTPDDGRTFVLEFASGPSGGVVGVGGIEVEADGPAAIMTDASVGSAVRLKGDGVVRVRMPKGLDAANQNQWTIEALAFDENPNPSAMEGHGLVSAWADTGKDEPMINFGKVGHTMHSDERRGPDGLWVGATNAGHAKPGRWSHYAAVYDLAAGKVVTYLDGKRMAEGAAPNQTLPIASLRIGGWRPHAFAWNGMIAAVRVANVARSEGYLSAAAKDLLPDGPLAVLGPEETRGVEPSVAQPAIPTCLEPIEGATVYSARPRLAWTLVPGIEHYSIEVSRNADMSHACWKSEVGCLPTTVCTGDLPQETPIYWRVSTGDGRWSEVSSFTVTAPEQEARKADESPLKPPKPKVARSFEPGDVNSFRAEGAVGDRVTAALENWALRVPGDNPDLVGMFHNQWRTEGFLPWWGESFGKFYQGASLLYRMTGDKRLRKLLDREISQAIAYQEPSGYLGALLPERRLFGPGPGGSNWDLYNGHHTLMALLEYHEATHDERSLRAAMRMADLWCGIFGPGKRSIIKDIPGPDQCNLGIISPLTWLYRLTGRARYLNLAKFVVDEIEAEYGPRWFKQAADGKHCSEMPGNHALEQFFVFEGITDLYFLTGDTKLRDGMFYWWRDMTDRERMAHGNLAVEELWAHKPESQSWAETCVTTAYIRFTLQILYTTGDPRCADMMEDATLNAYFGAQRPDGALWTYPVPVNGTKSYGWYTLKPEDPDLGCCFTYALTGMGLIPRWATMSSRGNKPALVINYYGQGKSSAMVDGQTVRVEQSTAYPCEPDVTLTLRPEHAGEFDVLLRIPYWSKQTSVHVNDEGPVPASAGQYLRLRRHWTPGDRIHLRFDFTPRVVQGSGETEGRVAVYRGPLLLTMDERFNQGYDPAKSPLDAGNLSLAPRRTLSVGPKTWVTLDAPTIGGGSITLCDFASAGALGERYEGWIKASK